MRLQTERILRILGRLTPTVKTEYYDDECLLERWRGELNVEWWRKEMCGCDLRQEWTVLVVLSYFGKSDCEILTPYVREYDVSDCTRNKC